MEMFVLRVWVPGQPHSIEKNTPIHGLVEHVGSGTSDMFHSAEELGVLLQRILGGAIGRRSARDGGQA
jgi:hypothetical protein